MKTKEPAAIGTFAALILSAVVQFADLNLTQDEQSSICAVIVLAAGAWIRSRVTPVA